MIIYPIFSNLCKKSSRNVIGFTILHLSEATTGSVLLKNEFFKKFRKIYRKILSAKSLFRRLLLIFLVSFPEDFLFISFQQRKWDEKREIPWWFFDQKMCLKRLWFCNFYGQRNFAREKFLCGEHLTSSSTKTA